MKDVFRRTFVVAEGHMVEIDLAVRHFHDRIGRFLNRWNLGQNLLDSFRGVSGNRNHDKSHRDHIEGIENLHHVREHGCQFAGREARVDVP